MRYLLVCLLLTNCMATKQYSELNKPKLDIVIPKQLQLNQFSFNIITSENSSSYLDENAVYYCLDASNYKRASENLRQVADYIKLQKRVIEEYKKYYEGG